MAQLWVAIIGALLMVIGLIGVLHLVIRQGSSIGVREIHFLAIALVLPLVLVLGIVNVLGRETISVVIGVVLGYVLSSLHRE